MSFLTNLVRHVVNGSISRWVMYHKKQYNALRPPLSCHIVLYHFGKISRLLCHSYVTFLHLGQLRLYHQSNPKWNLSKWKWKELQSLLIPDIVHKHNYHMPSHFLNTFSPVCALVYWAIPPFCCIPSHFLLLFTHCQTNWAKHACKTSSKRSPIVSSHYSMS
jgi:hypothetical protein